MNQKDFESVLSDDEIDDETLRLFKEIPLDLTK